MQTYICKLILHIHVGYIRCYVYIRMYKWRLKVLGIAKIFDNCLFKSTKLFRHVLNTLKSFQLMHICVS